MKIYLLIPLICLVVVSGYSQNSIEGHITSNREPVPFANVFIENSNLGTATNEKGYFIIEDVPDGRVTLVARAVGYVAEKRTFQLYGNKNLNVAIHLKEDVLGLEEVVVSGTRTAKRRVDNPIAVNILDSETFRYTQSATLSEGLNFQPGLRTEIDCQTCNYSQLRMNGLKGSYTQILINNRPVFGPLQGLYGLEQIPASIIERVEVVRGGGSSMYGSSAIAGTVNIITKMPDRPAYDFSVTHSAIGGQSHDNLINASVATVSDDKKAGLALFASRRARESFDANGDGFTEIPLINANSFGVNTRYLLTDNTRIELNGYSLYEKRKGGNKLDKPPHLADQNEDRVHNIFMGGVSIDHQFTENHSASIYVAGQRTDREHFTGIAPDVTFNEIEQAYDSSALNDYLKDPPYGVTKNHTWQGGMQLNWNLRNFITGANLLTVGAEYQFDDIRDEITAYNYLIDQSARQLGIFVQSDWALTPSLTFLSGVRLSDHSHMANWKASPRIGFLLKPVERMQVRASYATGFRAAQAFDDDLHIAFAGGGISRIRLSPALKEETSNSFSASVDYDKSSLMAIYGFTLAGFYTRLNNPFVLEEAETLQDGIVLEKRNGAPSTVRGLTLELRANYNAVAQLESGLTWQKSEHAAPVYWSAEAPGQRSYLRTPDLYGFYTLSLTPNQHFSLAFSGIMTGRMKIPHFGGAPGVDGDRVMLSPVFWETNLTADYTVSLKKIGQQIRFFGGVKNLFDQYQDDFDLGKNRDSNYIYGPAKPRTLFVGIRVGQFTE